MMDNESPKSLNTDRLNDLKVELHSDYLALKL